jgi:regulator of protease activity HflC (stomatin/prohibitin superfamily)
MPIGIDAFSVFAIFVLVVIGVTVALGVKTVPQGSQWTVERFGRYTRTLNPGLSLIIPYVELIGRKLSVMETVLDIPEQEVITKDNATVRADGIVFFQILDSAKAAYEVQNLQLALTNLAMTNIRSVIGAMDLDEVLSRRDEINRRLLSVVDQATTPWGVKATRIELRNITPPADILESMARQMKAEREKRAAVLEAEGMKQAAILKAEGAKEAQIREAEGRREAAFRDAEARERLAEAEANATRAVSQAIASGDGRAINYFLGQKYIEAFHALARGTNQKLILMPMETSAVIGAIAGIAEIARDALKDGAAKSSVPATAGGADAPPAGPWNPTR